MATINLYPNAFYPYGRGSWGANTGSVVDAISDYDDVTPSNTDATYARLNSNYTGSPSEASLKYRVAPQQIPGGAKVKTMRIGVRAKTNNASVETHFRMMIQNIRGGNPVGVNWGYLSGQKGLSTSFTTIMNEVETTTMSNGKYYGDGSITQEDINNLVAEVYNVGSTQVFFSLIWIEIDYDEKPTITLNSPGTITETTSPVITWDYEDDQEDQESIDVELLDSDGNVIHEDDNVPAVGSFYAIPFALENGDYTIRIRARQAWSYAGEAPVSDWDETDFTISVGRPANPTVVVTEEQSEARVKLAVKTNLNLFSVGLAEGEPAAWNDTFSAIVRSGQVVDTGSRSLVVELTDEGSEATVMSVPAIAIEEGTVYAFMFKVRAFPGDPLAVVQAGVRWLDEDLAVISDTLGGSINEVDGEWMTVNYAREAPTGARFARPFFTIFDNTPGAWHYADSFMFLSTVEDDRISTIDGDFETNTNGWVPINCSFAVSATEAHTGAMSGLMTVSGTPGQAFVRPGFSSRAAVEEGKYYRVSFWAKSPTGLDLIGAVIDWFDDTEGGYISTDAIYPTLAAGEWVYYDHAFKAPPGAQTAAFGPSIFSPPDGAQLYVDELYLRSAEYSPDWSRGGFLSTTENLLSYGDSTLETVSHYTVPNEDSHVEVVSYPDELDEVDRYQGNNCLKLTTTFDLARRDNEPVLSNTTSIVIPKGDAVEGDFMLAFIHVQGSATTVATPSGWTLLGSTTDASQRTYLFWHFATASEPASTTFTASASGKHGGWIQSWSGIDHDSPVYDSGNTPGQSGTTFNMSTVDVPHNAPVIMAAMGRRAASLSATTWSSNLGDETNYDVQISSTANTANEVAFGGFSRRYNTGLGTTDLSLSGRTMTSNASLTDVTTWIVVLNPKKVRLRAGLRDYEYYEYSNDVDYAAHFAIRGADEEGAPNSATRLCALVLELFDNDKNLLSQQYISQNFAIVGEWKKISNLSNITPVENAVYSSVRLEVIDATGYEAYYIDAISVYPSTADRGYQPGYKEVDGPYVEVQYSEDGGETWKTSADTDSNWMVQAVTNVNAPEIIFYDYEIASQTPRIYRVFNWKIEEGNLLSSEYVLTDEAEIRLRRIWMHTVADPESTIYQFRYDGTGRDETFDKQANVVQYAGREYGQVNFGETSERTINANVQLPTSQDLLALRVLDRHRGLIIFRDGRGRRVKGLLTARLVDTKWGNTASLTIQVLGLQP